MVVLIDDFWDDDFGLMGDFMTMLDLDFGLAVTLEREREVCRVLVLAVGTDAFAVLVL